MTGEQDADVPEEVRALAGLREAAREAKEFALADELRERIRDAGFAVADTPTGQTLEPLEEAGRPGVSRARPLDPSEVVNLLDEPPVFDATVHWIVEGWPQDVVRGIRSFDRHHPDGSIQHVVVDLVGVDAATWPRDGRIEVFAVHRDVGWAAGRNAGLLRSLGRIVLVVDGSVEATGDVLSPLSTALSETSVGVTGPFGIVTSDLREFRGSPGPDVDAIESYLLALDRGLLAEGLRFDDKFRFYRTADIELSFQVKARGLRATVTPVPVRRHEHRMWASTPEDRRAALSKRNYYRFLDRWRGRFDLTVGGATGEEGGP